MPRQDQENTVKANLWRTELTDMVDEIDRSMNSYRSGCMKSFNLISYNFEAVAKPR